MKISYKTDYALKTILDLAIHGNDQLVSIKDIAKRQDIPINFLEQILLVLKGAGLLASKRGPQGGYRLSKQPKDISIGAVLRLFEGTLAPITCVSRSCYSHCDYEDKCPFHGIWKEINEYLSEKLDHVTFDGLAEKAIQMQKNDPIDYMI